MAFSMDHFLRINDVPVDPPKPKPASTPVDASDRKFYVKAAENGNKQALEDFDATLYEQSKSSPPKPVSSDGHKPHVKPQRAEDSSDQNLYNMAADRQNTIIDLENRAVDLNQQLADLPTDSFSGYVRPGLQAELDDVERELDGYRQQDLQVQARELEREIAAVPNAPYVADAKAQLQSELDDVNQQITDLEIKKLEGEAADINEQLADLPSGSFSGYARQGMEERLAEIEEELSELRGDDRDQSQVADGNLATNNTGLPIDTSGQYAHILSNQGAGLNLGDVDTINDGQDDIIIQTIYDPVVSGKETIVDEYSVVVELPPGVSPQDLLYKMADDLDGVIPEVRTHGDFRNQSDEPGVGVISEIDINEGPLPLPDFIDESAINAPVVMTEFNPDSHFIFQTIEHNGNEHPLHGSREFGFEELDDGKVRIYTRAVAAPDILGAEIAGLQPERDMWTTFISGVENYVADNGGEVHGRTVEQDWGPTGDQFWNLLPRDQQIAIRDSQTSALEAEIDRLMTASENVSRWDLFLNRGAADDLVAKADALREELQAWNEKEITGQ